MSDNVVTLLPSVKVYSHDLDEFYDVIQIGDRQFSCKVNLPPNLTAEDIEYKFECYTNDEPTGIFTNIIVTNSDNIEYLDVDSFWSENYYMPGAGGDITLYISFDEKALPSVKIVSAIDTLNVKIEELSNDINTINTSIGVLNTNITNISNSLAPTDNIDIDGTPIEKMNYIIDYLKLIVNGNNVKF